MMYVPIGVYFLGPPGSRSVLTTFFTFSPFVALRKEARKLSSGSLCSSLASFLLLLFGFMGEYKWRGWEALIVG